MVRWALAGFLVVVAVVVGVAARLNTDSTRAQSGTSIVVPGLAADSVAQAVPTPEAAAWVDLLAVYTVQTNGGSVTSSVSGRAPVLSESFQELTGTGVPGTPVLSLANCSGPYTVAGTSPLRTYQLNFPTNGGDLSTMSVVLEPPVFRYTMQIMCPNFPAPVPFAQDTLVYWFAIHSGEINASGGYTLTGFTAPPPVRGCIIARYHKKTIKQVDDGNVEEDLSIVIVDRENCPVVHDIDVGE